MTAKKIKKNPFHWLWLLCGILVASLLLSACGEEKPEQIQPTPASALTPTSIALPSATLAPQPSTLNICTAQEPASLYRYDGRNSESKKTIFSALYGQAIMDFDQLSGLLERVPSFENDDIQLTSIDVADGDVIMDAHGSLIVLRQGSEVLPMGCTSADCVITWDGESPLTLPVLQIRYRLKEDLKWSDGKMLGAEDVLFAYQVASDEMTPSDKGQIDLTDNVSVEGDHIFIWRGVPGLMNQDPEHSFWLPLPKHQFGNLSAVELLGNKIATSEPLGWGAYRLVEWEKEKQLLFEINPFFISTDLTRKSFDNLKITILTDPTEALSAFNNETCDVLDSSYHFESVPFEQLSGMIHVITPFEVGTLVIGVTPARYDDGRAASEEERADYFSDVRTRQAIALCVNPTELSASLSPDRIGALGADLTVDAPKLPVADPNALLEAVGWVDDDGDPNTARVSMGVENVADLTPFEINLVSGLGDVDTKASAEIRTRLGSCGINVNVSNLPANQLYAPGPEGILFGRQFDLAIVNWAGNIGTAKSCEYYLSSQVPETANHWVGTNLAGYRDDAFDVACLTLRKSGSAEITTELLNPMVAIDLIPRFKVWMSIDNLEIGN